MRTEFLLKLKAFYSLADSCIYLTNPTTIQIVAWPSVMSIKGTVYLLVIRHALTACGDFSDTCSSVLLAASRLGQVQLWKHFNRQAKELLHILPHVAEILFDVALCCSRIRPFFRLVNPLKIKTSMINNTPLPRQIGTSQITLHTLLGESDAFEIKLNISQIKASSSYVKTETFP